MGVKVVRPTYRDKKTGKPCKLGYYRYAQAYPGQHTVLTIMAESGVPITAHPHPGVRPQTASWKETLGA